MRELYWKIFITKSIKCSILTFVEIIKKNCCLYLNVKEKKNRFTKKRKKRKKKKTETKMKKISMACRRSNTWLKQTLTITVRVATNDRMISISWNSASRIHTTRWNSTAARTFMSTKIIPQKLPKIKRFLASETELAFWRLKLFQSPIYFLANSHSNNNFL